MTAAFGGRRVAVLAAITAASMAMPVRRQPAPFVTWHLASRGVEAGELTLQPDRIPWRTHVIVSRVDPARTRLEIRTARRDDGRGAWSIDSAPAGAVLATNAGQFSTYSPWGWIVHHGSEMQAPGTGPLSAAFVVDGDERVSLVPAESLAAVRARGHVLEAVQSYPVLLDGDGALPAALTSPDHGVDLEHRDSRLAIGIDDAGRVVLALTRFDAFDGVPLGPTVPEMAALMRELGCRRAMLLDGGISSQLLLRDGAKIRTWRGFRRVPVALVVFPR